MQQSLDEDVKEWKNKALEYRRQLKSLQASIEIKQNEKENQTRKMMEGSQEEEEDLDEGVIDFELDIGNDGDHGDGQAVKKNKSNDPPVQSIELFHNESQEDGSNDDDDDDDDDDILDWQAKFQQQKIDDASKEENYCPSSTIKESGNMKELKSKSTMTPNNGDEDEDENGFLFADLPPPRGSSEDEDDEDGESEEEDDLDEEDSIMEQFKTKMLERSIDEKKQRFHKKAICCLIEVHHSLESLGVTLVDKTVVEKEKEDNLKMKEDLNFTNKNDMETSALLNSDEMIANQPLVFVEKSRRTDLTVATHLMQTLRSLIRIPNLEMEEHLGNSNDTEFLMKFFQPFISLDYKPCCYKYDFRQNKGFSVFPSGFDIEHLPQHPAVQGLHSICHILAIMDTYCSCNSPFIQQDEWDSLFIAIDEDNLVSKEEAEDMKMGMYARNITNNLLKSLHGEILTWTEIDKITRETTTSLQYLKEDDESLSDSDLCNMNNQRIGENGDIKKGDELVHSFCSKNKNRLFLLLERISIARMVSSLYQYQSDLQSAARIIIEYVLCNTPSPIEDYPRYSPTMSMCVLEALLLPISDLHLKDCSRSKWSPSVLMTPYNSWFGEFLNDTKDRLGSKSLLGNSIAISIFSAKDIWKQRKDSSDRRVREISLVELAAFSRIVESEKEWLNLDYDFDSGVDLLETNIEHYLNGTITNPTTLVLPIQFSLQQSGDICFSIEMIQRLLMSFNPLKQQINASMWSLLVPFFKGCTFGIQHFKWESNCLLGMSIEQVRSEIVDDERLAFNVDQMIKIYQQFVNCDKNVVSDEEGSKFLENVSSSILQSCLIIGDGLRAVHAASLIAPYLLSGTGRVKTDKCCNDLGSVLALTEFPVVRIINLKCRPDRWKNSITQAQRHQLFAVLAVAKLCLLSTNHEENDREKFYWGAYAHSGIDCNHLELEKYISQNLKVVADYVATHWRPRDLKAFDRFARDDDRLVRTSVSERACALSHISSWYGVHNTLSEMLRSGDENLAQSCNDDKFIQHLFRISGYARGPSLLSKNSDMLPCPVCIILEDDAMLVDRFSERLGLLLSELPRDFHYCSIGFSRPKTAPMVPYSSQIGIPTCLWYCTGYILSLEGAKHLIDCLPVVGPVDSWIGLKMTANWDNTYGQRIGVGNVTKALIDKDMVPSRKDLGVVMKFRAFAAITPLCLQKLKFTTSSSASNDQRGAKWRDRDTDVTYSGRQ